MNGSYKKPRTSIFSNCLVNHRAELKITLFLNDNQLV